MSETSIELAAANALACPISGEICDYRVQLLELYSEKVPEEVEHSLSAAFSPVHNSTKLGLKLTEHTLWAQSVGCDRGVGKNCPVREVMDNSMMRKVAVKGIRRLRQHWSS